MYAGFFFSLREAGVPATLREYLAFLEALPSGAADYSAEGFYYLARCTLVKDERHMDRFDRVFAHWFEGIAKIKDPLQHLPEEWLKNLGEKHLSEDEKARIKALGGWDKLMEELKKRLAEQAKRHQGGSKWIGTGGTSPFGAWGYNPFGVRIGQDKSRHRRAVKVWDKREFKNLDDRVELGTRNMKLALRRLRRFTREGAADQLDIDETVRATADNAGYLDLAWERARENRVKVLLLLDIGGSMDDHIHLAERLFSAVRAEFKHLEAFYFHNCLYERVWRDNRRRQSEVVATEELMRTYGSDYRVIFVGDASMSPYEIVQPAGSVEHWNEEAGATWMRRVMATWERVCWINPVPENQWRYTPSMDMIRTLVKGRMVPLTLDGLDRGIRYLQH